MYGDIRGTFATHIDLTQEDAPVPQIPMVNANLIEDDENMNAAICGVWFYYKNKSGDELERISHEDGSVWEKYYKVGQNIIINNDTEKRDIIKQRAKIGFDKSQALL